MSTENQDWPAISPLPIYTGAENRQPLAKTIPCQEKPAQAIRLCLNEASNDARCSSTKLPQLLHVTPNNILNDTQNNVSYNVT